MGLKKSFGKIAFLFVAMFFLHGIVAAQSVDSFSYEEPIPDFKFDDAEYGTQAAHKEIDLPDSERTEVEIYRRQYLSPKWSSELYAILKDGEQYRHYIRHRLIKEKMPLCIEFIPVIESSYKARATPKNGSSVGLWQFMENSIENYLRKTQWIDERRDPWKSTDAALKKLKANYKTFGDWLLAIAAYNCGAGALKRALKKSNEKNFWALSKKKLIPEATIKYIPRLLAISDIVINSDYYNANMPEFIYYGETYSPFIDFDYITVDSMVSIKRLAMEMRISEEILERLNPALVYSVTPPNEKYKIRLPAGMGGAAKDALFVVMLENKITDND